MPRVSTPLILGWEEWVSLPGLGLPAVKAKVDTGARTSALHAALIEPFGAAGSPMVRFVVHPVPGRDDIEIVCSAPVIGRREVASSNGERENRFVIVTDVAIGGLTWPIEITLTNRETMSYRMLLGRQAIRDDMTVEPASSFRQPRLSYRAYRTMARRAPVPRALRIAVITQKPDAASIQRLAETASARGHVVERIDPSAISLTFAGTTPGLASRGVPLGHFDAVVPRIGRDNPLGPAVVRQLEAMGAFALNPADALERLQHPLTVLQLLAEAGLAAPPSSIRIGRERPRLQGVHRTRKRGGDAERSESALPASGHELRLLVVGHKVLSGAELKSGRLRRLAGRPPVAARRIARRATRVLRLGLATVDVAGKGDDYRVARISAAPTLSPFEKLAGADVAGPIIDAIEARVRPRASRPTERPSDHAKR